MNSLVKAFTHFCFHFDLNIISHNLNDQVCAIIIAHHEMDDQAYVPYRELTFTVSP